LGKCCSVQVGSEVVNLLHVKNMPKNEDEMEFISVNDVSSFDDQTLGGGAASASSGSYGFDQGDESVGPASFLKFSKHPTALVFHLLFKGLALFLYIFGDWFMSNFVLSFVLCIILLAFDFWTTKNVSGRLLVGLRWWSYVKDDGSNEWVFESLEDMTEISPFDSRIFWGALYATPVVWVLLFVIGTLRLKFEYLPVVAAAIAMGGANVVGYYKCSNDATDKMQNLMEQGIRQGSAAALSNSSVMNWLLSSMITSSGSGGSNGGR